ncbi:PREDICTED: helicase and polymerase-containing protein TEBICHI isoform X1 [Ipomoea nil]|uniref:helicase and polymerase-containing protein TEBICHI isoform X1 n=1 Tax=Ipomoea nil TaxID=35883 RepID=UPI000901EB6F|nr:PREDICTED: helicase and polymerase-containing protein TEBICHI isoform X1 [Ipomoea nil]XP_019189920.1 PREDICTED: helicase and polymerase-containing protein TEBICHI isoform X1 [Ipomoea nil]XP_019189921.1 PREDICTED: helicase and polymerase-containing protein TEBICHI isoform X1 [Ipomoea nil]
MDSDAPRARIDQFFASKKKRKFESPALKSPRVNKDAKISIEGSPGTKGSLESYLVNSKDNSTPLQEAGGSAVKRNLTLDLGLISKHGKEVAVSSRQAHSQGFETTGEGEKFEVLSDTGFAARELPKDSLESTGVQENLELKQFASDFLSLYCSEVPPSESLPLQQNVHPNKRHASPSTCDLDVMTSKGRRPFTADGSHSSVEDNTASSPNKYLEDTYNNVAAKSAYGFVHSSEVNVDRLAEPQISLRKCNNVPVAEATESLTPGLSATKHVADTPSSGHRTSIFSPGETFWNEAIQVADGLFAGNKKVSYQVTKETEALNTRHEILSSNNLKNGGCDNKSNKIIEGIADKVSGVGMVPAIVPIRKIGKELDKEVSPLPVKHFDFALEDKIFSQSKNCQILSGQQARHVSATNQYVHSTCNEAQVNESSLEENVGTSKYAASKSKVEVFVQDNGSPMFNTPTERSGDIKAISESSEDDTPSSFALQKDRLDLSNWLPPEICSVYKKKGISKLYTWQVDCLQVDGVLENRNLVYCASTSAGKSFVAEILMLRRILSKGKMAILVLPYVSICAEKADHLEVLLEPLGKQVRSYYGNQGGGALPKDTSVAVCTIEKANSLVNRLLEEGRLSELGIIVIDELHMVGDRSRGYLLELLLTKLRYAAGEGNTESSSGESSGMSSGKADPAHGLQIVGMSATLPNVAAVAGWLDAALYQTDFRPVPLEEYIKVGNTIYNRKMEIVRTMSKAAVLGGKDPDHIVELCNEVVQDGHSVLIFCSSRKGCESTARHVAKYLKKFSVSPYNNQTELFDIDSAIDALRRSPAGLDPTLEETLPAGVAYHHAGLMVEERETVESCYRKGLVRVLTATSTLAAGVNLPARRVIFRQPRIGCDFIDGTRYRQMAGRAGRTGIDTKGESVLICKPDEIKRILRLLNDSCPPLHSCLSDDKNGMIHAILEVVAGGIVQTANDIHRYVRCTLLNSTRPFEDVVKSAQDSLRWLCHRKFLEWSDDTKLYTITPLGRASFGSCLSPEESLVVLDDLLRAREGFVLASDLHLVYLVTPINLEVEPDWDLYYARFMELPTLDQSVGNRVGVQEPFLMRMAHGAAPVRSFNRSREGNKGLQVKLECKSGVSNHSVLSDEQVLRVSRRFFVALILTRLVQEVPVPEVCDAFKVTRGMVQGLQENAGRFASMVAVFCERLGWQDLEGLVAKFQNRVSFGVRAEIVELTTIPYVKGSRARALYKSGLRTPQAIAEASLPEIVKALFESSSWSEQGSVQRRMQLGVAKKIKNGARKIVLEKAEEARIAAFSAFKSLGLDVAPLSRPLLSTAAGNADRKESSTSSDEKSTSSFVHPEHINHVVSTSAKEGNEKINGVISEAGEENSKGRFSIQYNIAYGEPVSAAEGYRSINSENETSTIPLQFNSNEEKAYGEDIGHMVQKLHDRDGTSTRNDKNALESGPVNAVRSPGGFDTFLDLWDAAGEFYFDIHFNKRSELSTNVPSEIHGIGICWQNSPVYYVNFPKDLFWSNSKKNLLLSNVFGDNDALSPKHQWEMALQRWDRIRTIMGKSNVKKFTWNLKKQIQVLECPAVSILRFGSVNAAVAKAEGLNLNEGYYIFSPVHLQDAFDLCIVAWILWPDEEKGSSLSLEKEVKKRLSSEAAASANQNGRWKNQMRKAAHNGCCRRVAQTRALCLVLWKLLISEGLLKPLTAVEMPLVDILSDMELWGIGVDMEGCLRAREIVRRKLKCLEREAYMLAGMNFSLNTPADIANVLYNHLKLPIPNSDDKGKQHPSTDKHCLDLLRDEHPIIPVIKEHRTLAKLLNCTLGSICSLARLSMRTQRYTLHGHWLQTSTGTGRLSMEEPNLQCVEHMIDFKMNNNDKADGESNADHYKINARDFFVPTQENWLFLTADYSQIELRLMAHFSKDSSLIELLSNPHGDVFTMIAARWTGKSESIVSSKERDQTKRLVYGILYGMGSKSLAEQLGCSSDEAIEKIQSFKGSFPGVASWLQEAVSICREKGYVETLNGRKRFLSKIKFGNSKEKSKAQRQAVNSICQGSAADIIKIAMISVHSAIVKDIPKSRSNSALPENFDMLKGRCRIVLQVHDELVLEADPSVVKEAAMLLRTSMENAASLLVPLRVKLMVGRTWGSLEPFLVEGSNSDVTVPTS